ncbi:MAG: alpha/beta hydrolase [Oligoflexia bacterium]|nr:alpha/beta hydrolase [Oligoflexia bacterium]
MRKKKLLGLGFIGALLIILAVVARFVFPLELNDRLTSVALWRGGVHRFHSGRLSGYVKDFCEPSDPEARGCTCVALIHGLGDEPETWKKVLLSPASEWKRPVRLYALDVPRATRFAPGDAPESYRVRAQAHEIAEGLKPLCPRFVVVGNSLGGWISAWVAIDHELPLEKLVLSGAAGLRGSVTGPDSAADLFLDMNEQRVKEIQKRAYSHPHEWPEYIWKKLTQRMMGYHLEQVARAQVPDDLLDGRLQEIRVPTLVLWGGSDRIVPLPEGHHLQEAIPGSILKIIPDCGHVPQKECVQPYLRIINDFL